MTAFGQTGPPTLEVDEDHMRNNNKRMRGRNRGKGPNPLTRSYESNGPDIKVRGTAQHIAEKYLQLARDAHTSGDPVAAEGYLQHAEHYFRLIAAAQEQQRIAQGLPRADGQVTEDDSDEDDDEDFVSPFDKRFEAPQIVRPEPQQQPQPRTDFGHGQQPGGPPQGRDRERYPDRQDRPRFQDRQGGYQERGERQPFQDRQGGYQDRGAYNRDAAPAEGSEQPGFAGGEGEGGEGRRFESRRDRFERRRHERFLERQARREAGGYGEGEQPASGGEDRVEPRQEFRQDIRQETRHEDRPAPAARTPRAEPEADVGLPAFITGGMAPAEPAAEPAAAPKRRGRPAKARPSSDETSSE